MLHKKRWWMVIMRLSEDSKLVIASVTGLAPSALLTPKLIGQSRERCPTPLH